MEAHGGYLVRLERFDSVDLVRLAREALVADGQDPANASLQISVIPRRKIVRLAYDAPFTYGRAGAQWYSDHHALAMLLSATAKLTVQAYVLDDDFEEVVAYGNGRRVGGELLRYESADLGEDDDMTDADFEKVKSRWPLGHLAYVFGVSREELLTMPRTPSGLLSLDGSQSADALGHLLPSHTLSRAS